MRRSEPQPVNKLETAVTKRHDSTVAKCHPAIFELAQLLKDSIEARKTLGPNPSRELVAKIEGRLDRRLAKIHEKYSGSVQPAPNTFAAQIMFSDDALKSDSDEPGIAEWIHFERHKKTAKVDAKKRAQRDWDAGRRVLRTASDLEQLRCGRGPLLPFKGDSDHSSMFGALWGLGIEKLAPEELADFFDLYCPCGREGHDPDALKKQRTRFQNVLALAVSESG
ncbi:MAG TPA: hypothetical protein VNE63_02090 [Candidatus Acidoferrales bacterium]|nr:hypothetical protein [Candidatus Acidoferrales bacterium]